jgi:hypothetical protein
MKRRHLTDEQIRKLPRKTKRYTLADPELIGHYLRVPPRKSKAAITFVAVHGVTASRSGPRLALPTP